MMETSSTQQRLEPPDSITVTVGNTVFTVEHVYEGNRSLPEVMSDFLAEKIGNLED